MTPTPTPLDELWGSFVAAAAELREPAKGATATVQTRGGRDYSYSYLTLPQLSDVVRAVFARHELAFRQSVTTGENRVTVTTTLIHRSGACWTGEPLSVRAASLSPQDVGSASTYGRRYSLAALVGLSGADDDAASQRLRTSARTPDEPPQPDYPPNDRPTPAALRELADALTDAGHDTPESMRAAVSAAAGRAVGHAGELSAAEVARILDSLRAGDRQ